ncbi:MAG: 50S ribosomal protein L11 methyltransferase [Bacteroidota bacterium]
MANYIQLEFKDISAEHSDLLLAALSGVGFEGFEEGENNLKACIPATDYDAAAVKVIAAKNELNFVQTTIVETNWNAVWESNFQPVTVNDFVYAKPWVGIRADFHEPIAGVEHEIVITPKMSFGTGHHATTYMMIQQMQKMDFTAKTVFDFGTGTGILSILAEKLGAEKIIAVDSDDWSIANTTENLERNLSVKVQLSQADSVPDKGPFDIILANINKNVILENFSSLVKQLRPAGILLISGLLEEDKKDILEAAGKLSLILNEKTTSNNWLALRFTH